MRQGTAYLFAVAFSAASLLFGGCGTNNSDTNVTLVVRVSSLHYIKDANVSLEENQTAAYTSKGIYHFYESNVTGMRIASGGSYITDEDNESNTSGAPITCPQFDTNTTMPVLSAPGHAAGAKYEEIYINVNPFTSLIAEGNMTAAEMEFEFPTAYLVQTDNNVTREQKSVVNYDFDVTMARKVVNYNEEEHNLTADICKALDLLNQIQGLY